MSRTSRKNPRSTQAELAKVGYGPAKAGRCAISGGPNTMNASVANVCYRPSIVLPVTTSRWRLHWRNYNITTSSAPASTATSITMTGLYVGTPAVDATTGAKTGNFTAAPTQVIPSTAMPTDGTEWVSSWITSADLQFIKGKNYLLSAGLIGSSGIQWARAQVVVPYRANGAATDVAAQTISIAGTTPMYGDWWIEYEFDGSAPIGLHVGDSLTDGQSNGLEQVGSYVNTHAVRQSIAAAACAVSGITLQIMAGWPSTHHFWARFGLGAGWVPDYALLWAGTNDIQNDRTLAQMQADFASVVTVLRGFGINNIYVATAAPRNLTTAREAVRQSWNTWLYSRPFGVLGIFDFSAAVEASPGAITLLPAYNAGDDTHLLSPALARCAEKVPGRLGQ